MASISSGIWIRSKRVVPILSWGPKYNLNWFTFDLIAGLTVGFMLVPQSLAYAKLATLPVEYGLYSSFAGVMLYSFLGTSKDISVGPTAVLCLLVGSVIGTVAGNGAYDPVTVSVALCFLGGMVTLIMGLLRLGIILDFIPNPVIAGFTSGAAGTIVLGQIKNLLGVPNVNGNDSSYEIIISLLKNFEEANWADGFMGISSISILILFLIIRKRLGQNNLGWDIFGTAGNAFCVVLFTFVSYLINCNRGNEFAFSIVGNVPEGFPPVKTPDISMQLLSDISYAAVPVTVITILEHVAICKAFARKNGYQVDPSQELFSLGVCNILGSFFSAMPSTGSFSRSAVKSRSGVRTPLGGIWTGLVVIAALFYLTRLFFWIPEATLAAVIIVNAGSLISGWRFFYQLYKVQPWDFVNSILALLSTFFFGTEVGITVAVGFALLLLLYRISRPKTYVLERLYGTANYIVPSVNQHTIPPPSGIVVFKLQESLTFPNVAYVKEKLLDAVYERTRSGAQPFSKEDQSWSDDLEQRIVNLRLGHFGEVSSSYEYPLLRAVIFDFGAVNNIDSTGLQGLIDLKTELTKYSGETLDTYNGKSFEFHFVSVHYNIQKALENSGLTTPIAPLSPSEAHLETYSRQPNIHTPLLKEQKYLHFSIQDAVNSVERFYSLKEHHHG
ncbi:sulfate permease [Basidiobolus meristosporus CBS 931.73]|uniref:Sulfate permease n=1 Tax=Basidiobolus meristosporus CBS 931.73 TaxID=1314790 RepID=A0A1Y1YVZ3_9FUNG|nr:sulfate permease [Basidiobolus meristosporus CBS 931.73]|eukprot:ORY02004.1 sulfate permease [Basidiobolus meristosporus CBS 931.73]